MAIVAKALKKPFYVAAESYKFARLFPLNQSDLLQLKSEQMDIKPIGTETVPDNVEVSAMLAHSSSHFTF